MLMFMNDPAQCRHIWQSHGVSGNVHNISKPIVAPKPPLGAMNWGQPSRSRALGPSRRPKTGTAPWSCRQRALHRHPFHATLPRNFNKTSTLEWFQSFLVPWCFPCCFLLFPLDLSPSGSDPLVERPSRACRSPPPPLKPPRALASVGD